MHIHQPEDAELWLLPERLVYFDLYFDPEINEQVSWAANFTGMEEGYLIILNEYKKGPKDLEC